VEIIFDGENSYVLLVHIHSKLFLSQLKKFDAHSKRSRHYRLYAKSTYLSGNG